MADGGNRESEPGDAPKRTTIEARQGVTFGRMRYVLLASLTLAIAVMILAYIVI